MWITEYRDIRKNKLKSLISHTTSWINLQTQEKLDIKPINTMALNTKPEPLHITLETQLHTYLATIPPPAEVSSALITTNHYKIKEGPADEPSLKKQDNEEHEIDTQILDQQQQQNKLHTTGAESNNTKEPKTIDTENSIQNDKQQQQNNKIRNTKQHQTKSTNKTKQKFKRKHGHATKSK